MCIVCIKAQKLDLSDKFNKLMIATLSDNLESVPTLIVLAFSLCYP